MNSETNQLTRVLETDSARLKYTIRVNMPDGKAVEWQADEKVNVSWNDSLRAPWIFESTGYQQSGIMPWQDGMIIICERNKDVKD
jgi:hypothetical protein